jgi:hypothetical protein
LLTEVARDAVARLALELIAALRSHGERPDDRELLERVFRTFGEDGQARVIAWLELSGLTPSPSATDEPSRSLRRVAEVLHEHRGTGSVPENTLFTILLGSLAVFGDAIAGAGMRRSAGLAEDPETVRRFRDWLSELLVAQIRRGDGSQAH